MWRASVVRSVSFWDRAVEGEEVDLVLIWAAPHAGVEGIDRRNVLAS